MSTGAVINHGVSGYQCLGAPGDFQDQRRGEPWQVIVNDPIRSYMNAQNHIGIPLNNFTEFWTAGELREANFDAAPYRTPLFSEPLEGPPAPPIEKIGICPVEYPSFIGNTFPQELPLVSTDRNVFVPQMDRQNMTFENGTFNGDNKVFMPPTPIPVTPNTVNFQGASTATGVHPNSDKAGQQTTGNQSRSDFSQGQQPSQKLPNGLSIGALQPTDPPQLYDLAPPPDPQVLPGEGTAPLLPTTPRWW